MLHVGGLHYADEKNIVERVLGNRPGVFAVEANPVAQTATVTYDPAQTSVEALTRWVEECGYHGAGQSVPGRVCERLAEPGVLHEETRRILDDLPERTGQISGGISLEQQAVPPLVDELRNAADAGANHRHAGLIRLVDHQR